MSRRLSQGDTAIGYGHAERNLALIRQLEAEIREMIRQFRVTRPARRREPHPLDLRTPAGKPLPY
jgi:hypothetical protein